MNEKEIDKILLNSTIDLSKLVSKEILELLKLSGVRFSDNTAKIVSNATEEVRIRLSRLLERPDEGIIRAHLAPLALSFVLRRLCIEFPTKRIEKVDKYKFSKKLYRGLEFLARMKTGLDVTDRKKSSRWWSKPIENRLTLEGLNNEYDVKKIKKQIETANCPEGIQARLYAIALGCLHSGKSIDSTILAFSKLFHISCRRIVEAIAQIDCNALRTLTYKEKRDLLISDSVMQNKNTDINLCLYTPTEVLDCITSGKVNNWYEILEYFEYDFDYKNEKRLLLLFPCAYSKPWCEATTNSSTYRMLYSILNEMGLRDKVKIATISEPLAIVPEELYQQMPIYDCPGLFRAYTSDWQLPWNENDYALCIRWLGYTISRFIEKHQDKFFSVHAIVQFPSPHYDMISHAKNILTEKKHDKLIIHRIEGKIRENRTKVKEILFNLFLFCT